MATLRTAHPVRALRGEWGPQGAAEQGFSPLHLVASGSLLAMVAVSLVTRPPDRKILDQFFPAEERS